MPRNKFAALLACIAAFLIAIGAAPSIQHDMKKPYTVTRDLKGVPCGAKVTLTEDGVNHIANQVLPVILQRARTMKIPDMTGHMDTQVIGDIEYAIRNIQVQHVDVEGVSVTFNNGMGGINAVVNGISAAFSLEWEWANKNHKELHGAGTAQASLDHSLISTPIAMTIKNGRPAIRAFQVSVTLNNLKLHFTGGIQAWVMNMIETLFHERLTSTLETAVSTILTTEINDVAEKALSSMQVTRQINTIAQVDFTFCESKFSSEGDLDYVTFGSKGEVFWVDNPTEAPFAPVPMPEIEDAQMLQIFLSDYVFNSAAYAYFQAGALQRLITNEDVPPKSPIKLNTQSFKFLIPPLYKMCPDCDMQILASAAECPLTQFTSRGIDVQLVGNLTFQVIEPQGGAIKDAFTLEVELGTEATAGLIPAPELLSINVTGHLDYLNFTMSIKESNVGDFNLDLLKTIATPLIQKGALPYLNDRILKNGIPLPMPQGLTFQKPEIVLHDGFLVVATDVDYVLSKSPFAPLFAAADDNQKNQHTKYEWDFRNMLEKQKKYRF